MFAGVRLVVASACQSAASSATTLPDEYVGLASALLGAGAAAVPGALWPVYYLTTALLVGAFVRLNRDGDDEDGPPLSPAAALARAQRWLPDVTAGELAARFGEAGGVPGLTEAQALDAALYFDELDPADRPYADEPITWAGFVLVGAP